MDEHHELKRRRTLKLDLDKVLDKGYGDAKAIVAKTKAEKRRLKLERKDERRKKAA